MDEVRTLYDARQMGVADQGMLTVATLGALVFSAVATLSWRRLRAMRQGEDRTDPSRTLSRTLAMTAMALAALGYLAFALVENALWVFDYRHHRYEVLDGCVRDFSETVQRDHDLGTDTFTLNGRPFRLSDSGWRLGYHTSHHHGSPIQDNTHLRVFANGGRLLKIDVLPGGC